MNPERYDKALQRAIIALKEVKEDKAAKGIHDQYQWDEYLRVSGKIEGVKLALSYLLDEMKDEAEDEAETLRSDCLCWGCTRPNAWRSCGDYPAPCNCDDPEIHNGH